ncbi:MAG: DUF3142 domain-containing protein [Pyrinomonadaceae bacterium]
MENHRPSTVKVTCSFTFVGITIIVTFLTPMRFDFRILKFAAAIAFIPIALAVYATSGSSHREWSADEVPISFWAWKTALPETAELRNGEDKAGATKLFVRAGQMDLNDREVRRTRPAKGNLPESVEVHLVYNATRELLRGLESLDAEKLSTALSQTFAADVERFGSANIKGIQLDLDYPTRLLPQYERTVVELRTKLPPGTKLSITGLPTWMNSVEIKPLLAAVDFWTPQLYGAEIPIHIGQPIPISSAREIRRATIAAREMGKPFMAGLAAYGYAIQYDKSGDLVELRGDLDLASVAESESFEIVSQEELGSGAGNSRKIFRAKRDTVLDGLVFRAGESLVFDSPTMESLREAGRIVRSEAGHELLGICVFRLPTESDSTNLRLREIVDALRDRPATNGFEIKASLGDGGVEISAMNSGSASSFAHEALAIEITVPPGSVRGVLANNGFSGFETLCSNGSGAPTKCSSLRANVVRLTRNSWRPGDEVSIRLNANWKTATDLTAIIETRSDNSRIDRIQKTFAIEENTNEE